MNDNQSSSTRDSTPTEQHLRAMLAECQSDYRWHTVIKPLLGVLLVAQAPLSTSAISTLISTDEQETREGLHRLDAFVTQDDVGRFALADASVNTWFEQYQHDPEAYITAHDLQKRHQVFVDWCLGGAGGLAQMFRAARPDQPFEHERRMYARASVVKHLCGAKAYAQLWALIDAGTYGQAKVLLDPSAQRYVLDLDLVRHAVVDAASADQDHRTALIRLWRYSLLRLSLTSHKAQYPNEFFRVLTQLGRTQEALRLAGSLSYAHHQVDAMLAIAAGLPPQVAPPYSFANLSHHIRAIARTIEHADVRCSAFISIAQACITAGQLLEARDMLQEAQTAASTIDYDRRRAEILGKIVEVFISIGQLATAYACACTIPIDMQRDSAFGALATALAQRGHLHAATKLASHITNIVLQCNTLVRCAEALATTGLRDAARALLTDLRHRVHDIDDRSFRTWLLASVAIAFTKIGDSVAASQLVRDAHDLAQTINDPYVRGHAFRYLVDALAYAGLLHTFPALLEEIPADSAALSDLVEVMAQTSEFPSAIALARRIEPASARAKALCTLATAFLADGQHQAATDVLREATASARIITEGINEGLFRAEALSQIAAVHLQAGDTAAAGTTIREAQQSARAIEDASLRARVFCDITTALVQSGQTQAAFTLAQAIGDDASVREQVLSSIAAAQAGTEIPAVQVAVPTMTIEELQAQPSHRREFYKSYYHAQALNTKVAELAQADQLPAAMELAQTIAIASERAKALATMTQAYGARHQHEAVFAIIQQAWLAAQNRRELLLMLPLVVPFLLRDTALARELMQQFEWVDSFLYR